MELQAYLNELLHDTRPCAYCLDTHRPIADALLSQKQALAKSNGIQLEMELDDLSAFPLSDDDLVVVFSNLFDNAVEACQKIPVRERRKIVFQAKAANAVGYICMENTTQEAVRITNNRIAATSKSNSVLHGFGLRNVLYVLDKNQAVYQISYSEETHSFQFVAQITSAQ